MAPTRKVNATPTADPPVTRAELTSVLLQLKDLVDRVDELEATVDELLIDEDEQDGESLGSQDSDTNDEGGDDDEGKTPEPPKKKRVTE